MQQSIESSSKLEPVSHLCQMGELYIAPESWSFLLSLYTSPTSYSSGHPWSLVSISSSQCCQVILSDVPISLKIVCLESICYPILCTISHVLVVLWSLNHLPLFRMKDTSIPSFDRFCLVNFSTLFGISFCLLNYLILWEIVFFISYSFLQDWICGNRGHIHGAIGFKSEGKRLAMYFSLINQLYFKSELES